MENGENRYPIGSMNSSLPEANSDSDLSANELNPVSSGSSFFLNLSGDNNNKYHQLFSWMAQLIFKIESFGDLFIYSLRCVAIAVGLTFGFYIFPTINLYSRRGDNWNILTFFCLLAIIVLLSIVFSANTGSEKATIIQEYKDLGALETLSYGNIPFNLDLLTLNFQNPRRLIFSVALCIAAVVLCFGCLLGLLYLMIVFVSQESVYDLIRFLPFSLPVLVILLVALVIVCRQNTVIGYSLTFDENGIKGECNYCDNIKRPFVEVYGKPSASDSYGLIKCQGDYVRWENFLCFSYHKNCIVLWRSSQPRADFKAAMLIQFDLYPSLRQCSWSRPLRICGSELEVRELKDFLSGFMPRLSALSQNCQAII